jgi:hypothetical protein
MSAVNQPSSGPDGPKRKPRRQLTLDCPCGERIVGEGEDDLVEKARRHLAAAHPGRQYSREEILFLAF